MISSFISWTFLLIIVGGVLLHFDPDIPYLMGWLGKLPGDIVIRKGSLYFYFPITSSALTSLVFVTILHSFRKK